jgi:beta,beta-carotene 9',10'-dioxygenase
MSTDFKQGFATLDREMEIDHLPISGKMPLWLSGTLIRNGPAKFEVGSQNYRHWFDGLAMLHRFTFQAGEVTYANRFVRTRAYNESMAKGRIAYSEFATDPCRTVFQRFFSLFRPARPDNVNVNVTRIENKFLAMTETTLPYEFDPHTLKTLGVFVNSDQLPGVITTAHPHFDFYRGCMINYATQFSRRSKYNVYQIPRGKKTPELIDAIPAPQPCYMHSFGMSENYILLAEFPLTVNPLHLLLQRKPFIENFSWKPERSTVLHVISKSDHSIRRYTADAFFAFHHVNSFEQNGDIFVDIAAYPDKSVIDAFYLDNLRSHGPVPLAALRRYHLPVERTFADYETLSSESIELPRLNYKRCNSRIYRYVYGISNRANSPDDFNDQLVKIDVQARSAKIWHDEACYVGEPVFVASPDATAEDSGVVLSIVLDAKKGNSFLLLLDGDTFEEIARAEVPHHIPFGFHGQYFAD